ncbi:P27 family phage terminase small subunit [Paraburkholderia sp. J7]|uniref:P27 family phage terminase small subunit n=1 Tax=Paraburkholderia sp. J7 TaxID=2805438 RepID=UPI002AB6798E|nr:P27 family phage terminase small subunit [Paraburkholderia sp. J7]
MTHRGRRSTVEEAETVSLALVVPERMRPPKALSAPARKVWRDVLAGLPADFYSAIDAALLGTYCETVALNAEAARRLAAEGALIEADGRRVVSPAFRVFTTSSASMMSLATKLHLAHSSRLTRDAASTKASASVTARRPWARDTKG